MLPARDARERAIIVGSGPSARGFEPPPDITVIAVNGAIDWLPRADAFFTLDPSAANQRRLTRRRAGVRYFAAGIKVPGVHYFTRVARQGAEPEPRGTPTWWLWRWSAVPGLSMDMRTIHTGNSAYGALGLAYHLGFKHVALIGVDGTDDPRIESGRPANLSHLPALFASARPQIDVISCGALTGIPRATFKDWMAGC